MTAPLTTTVPVVLDAFLAAVNAETETTRAFESWPGTESVRKVGELFVLGEIDWDTYEIATIRADRKSRQEKYDIGWELFVMGAEGSSPADASPARRRAFNLLAPIEDLLAEDPTGGADYMTVQHVQMRLDKAGARLFEKAWAYRIAGQIHVEARLL